jgi:hypothetical protein
MEDFRKIKELLKSFDYLAQQVDELKLSENLNKFAKQEYGENWREKIPETLLAEIMAFEFIENYPNPETGWGTYYGPLMTFNDKEKGNVEVPSIKEITSSMIEYWEKRAIESKSPILKTRYADLVWDFTEKIKGVKPDYKMAVTVIESIIDIAERDLHKYQVSVIAKLKRALSLALSLNSEELISKVKGAMIAYEKKVAEDDKPGLWGFSFDSLLKNKNVQLTTEEKDRIIQDLEERLDRLSKSPEHNFWAAENAAIRLADYYSTINKKEGIRRVLLAYGKIVEAAVSTQPSAHVAVAWLEKLLSTYMQYGLKDEANGISIEIRKLGDKAASELKTIETSVTIPTEEVKKFINALIDGDLKTALARIAIHYIPKKGEAIEQLDNLSKEAPIQFLFTRKIQDSAGRIVASVGPLSEDRPGHIVLQISQNMSYSSPFLRDTIKALICKFDLEAETIVSYLYESPILEENRRDLIKKGIEEYLSRNYIVALHILIPQIEAVIRNLEEKTGGSVFKQLRNGGFNYKTLEDMLWDENIKNVFGILGEDVTFYFRTLFTDPRGWNLRNNICHGISTPETLNVVAADRVFHSLLCLSLVRNRREDNE